MPKTKQADFREPEVSQWGEWTQWNCRWPGCEFDTLDEAAWRAHIDPATGAHREPLGAPGELPRPMGTADLAELDALRAFKAQAETADAPDAPPAAKDASDKTKGD